MGNSSIQRSHHTQAHTAVGHTTNKASVRPKETKSLTEAKTPSGLSQHDRAAKSSKGSAATTTRFDGRQLYVSGLTTVVNTVAAAGRIAAKDARMVSVLSISYAAMGTYKDLKGLRQDGHSRKDDVMRLTGDALMGGGAIASFTKGGVTGGCLVAAAGALIRGFGEWMNDAPAAAPKKK